METKGEFSDVLMGLNRKKWKDVNSQGLFLDSISGFKADVALCDGKSLPSINPKIVKGRKRGKL